MYWSTVTVPCTQPLGQKVSGAGMGNNMAGLTYYSSNDDDPYITLKNVVRQKSSIAI